MEKPLGLFFRPRTAGPSPELTANVFSFITWQWCQKLVNLGNRKVLQEDDLYDMVPRESVDYNEKQWNKLEERQIKGGKKVSVIKLVYQCSGRELIYSFLCMPVWFGAVVSQVYTIRALVREAEGGGAIEWWRASLLVFSMWATSCVQSISQHWSFTFGQKFGLRIKAAMNMAVFNKVMKLRLVAMGGTSTGVLLNLISNDSQKFMDAGMFAAYSSFSVLICAVVCVLSIVEVGVSALPGVAVIFLAQPLQVVIARYMGKYRNASVKVTDARVRMLGETLTGVRVVKYNGWTQAFLKRIEDARTREIHWIKKGSYLRSSSLAMKDLISPIAALATFATYVAVNDGIVLASEAFTLLGLFAILVRVYHIAPAGIQWAWEAYIGLQRMQSFMSLPVGKGLSSSEEKEKLQKIYPEAAVAVNAGHFVWYLRMDSQSKAAAGSVLERVKEDDNFSLQDTSFSIRTGELVAVIGPVGGGKSSLLQALLGEMECVKGSFWTKRNVAYAPQQPWILNDNVRNNVLATNEYDEAKYKKVIFACALEHDIAELPAGDLTEIGERGVNLSGGQKARISLARACYSHCPVVLLDDPLAAVDVPTAKHLMQHVLGGVLKGRTVILVTHNKSSLEQADRIFAMEGGRLSEVHSKEDLEQKGLLDDELEDASPDAINNVSNALDEVTDTQGNGDLRTPMKHGPHRTPSIGKGLTLSRHNSKVEEDGRSASSRKSLSQTRKSFSRSGRLSTDVPGENGQPHDHMGALTVKEDRVEGYVTWRTYLEYVRGGGVPVFVLTMFLICFAQAVRVVVDYWIAAWVSDKYKLSSDVYLGSYGAFVAGAIILGLLRGFMYTEFSLRASRHMHREMAEKVLRSPQLFFDQNPVGRILNRFSKDQALVDELLPYSAQQMFENLIGVLGVVVFVAIIMPWFLLSLPPFVLAMVYGQRLYSPVSRELKRLDGLSRSPVYAHFGQTVQGLSSVRAYGLEGSMHNHFRDLTEANHRAMIAVVHLSRWLGLRLDFAASICVAVIALLVVLLRNEISPGLVGVVLLESLQLTGFFQYGIRLVADVENFFTSVERIQAYCDLPREARPDSPPGVITQQWPERGEVEFIKFTMAYRLDLPPVLNELTFKVLAEEKVGILGRTGAGKSSLAAALFRMVENDKCNGSIVIDGVDVKLVGLDDLRLRISIIPQDPVLFRGSVRMNLDPFHQHRDEELLDVLSKVELIEKIQSLDGGLASEVTENGENLSVGQRQLLCLARALLRKSKILVMDEATAAVDGETDQIIQKTLREVFQKCTVLTIAHRIDTVIDCDRVLVLAKGGRISEFDSPVNLLRRSENVDFAENISNVEEHLFANMIAQAGPAIARQLRKAAEAAQERKNLER